MTKEQAIIRSKELRVALDKVLQEMKDHKTALSHAPTPSHFEDYGESIAQHTISIRELENAIMRQGMVLKYIGNPTPYPQSYNPESTQVEPTADTYKPHQQRVIEEKTDLDARREKLRVFFDSETYRSLPTDEQNRLMRQFAYMANYSDVLGERIAAFPPS